VNNLRKGVELVFMAKNVDDQFYENQKRFEANVARYAAHKACRASLELSIEKKIADDENDFITRAGKIINQYQNWQQTEYHTAVARARTAKQWLQFNQPDHVDIYPNIRWLPSRSVNPREEHMRYYYMILPKDDPFWKTEFPGNLYNCTCDWEETYLEPSVDSSTVEKIPAAKGLENNPGITNEIFSNKAVYFKLSENYSKKSDSALRNMMFHEARETLKGKSVAKTSDNGIVNVGFTTSGINHLQADYFPDKSLRDILLPQMDKLLDKAEFVATVNDNKNNQMVKNYHYYKILIDGNYWYLCVRELNTGETYLYSIVDKLRKKD
jgi:hypothetical protein